MSEFQPPNILWLCTDQQRFDTIHALGNDLINTPHIDRLVDEGVAFRQAFCQSPVCTPSRASFMTGRYPRTTRCRQNGQDMPADEVLVTRTLADHGYTCGLAGKLHLGSCEGGRVEPRLDDGYSVFHWSHHPPPDWEASAYGQWLTSKGKTWKDIYSGKREGFIKEGVPTELHQTTWCSDMAIDFLTEQKGKGPWCFSWNVFDPHHPFDPPTQYMERYRPQDMPIPKRRDGELATKPVFQQRDHTASSDGLYNYDDSSMSDADRQRITAAYYAMIELIDDNVGRMMKALEDTGQLENTIVIFMSDHGEMLGDHGLYLKGPHFYDEAVRVPLVMRFPKRFKQGVQCDELVELLDIAPTLLQCADIDVPQRVQGKSLLPLLEIDESKQAENGSKKPHRPAPHREDVFSEYYNSWQHGDAYGSMLRTRDHKLVVYHGCDLGELYDLNADPDEFENLWDVPAFVSLKLDLMKRLFDRSVFSMDPAPPRLGAY